MGQQLKASLGVKPSMLLFLSIGRSETSGVVVSRGTADSSLFV
jgi:hypothetical protein